VAGRLVIVPHGPERRLLVDAAPPQLLVERRELGHRARKRQPEGGSARLAEDVAHRQAGVERGERVLEDDVDVAPEGAAFVRADPSGAVAQHDDAPALGRGQLEHLEQRRRLSSPGLADQPERLPLAHVERDPVDGAHRPHPALEHRAG
jgi:hypothetical protein